MSSEEVGPDALQSKSLQNVLLLRLDRRISSIYRTLDQMEQRLQALEYRPSVFPQEIVHQYEDLAPGQSGRVWYWKIPRRYIVLLRVVGCLWWPDTYLKWLIDGELKEKVERNIGNVNNPLGEPYVMPRPIVVRDQIEWIAYNNSSNTIKFGVLHDGEIYPKEIARRVISSELF